MIHIPTFILFSPNSCLLTNYTRMICYFSVFSSQVKYSKKKTFGRCPTLCPHKDVFYSSQKTVLIINFFCLLYIFFSIYFKYFVLFSSGLQFSCSFLF